MSIKKTITMHNGIAIPVLGLGTWFIDNDQAEKAVQQAVCCGYRHFDTAQAYGNEEGLGKGILSCGIPRSELFITSKIAAEWKSYDQAVSSIEESLRKLQLSYLDLMIIHSPQPWEAVNQSNHRYSLENKEVWRALEDAYMAKKIRAIGVSNFLQEDLENILSSCRIKPMVNQVLAHIGNTPFSLIEYCRRHDIIVEAYSPIAHGEMLKNRTVKDMALAYGVTVAQLCIQYVLQLGLVAIPKTVNPDHMRTNADLDFMIQAADMELLKQLAPITDYGQYSAFPVYGGKL